MKNFTGKRSGALIIALLISMSTGTSAMAVEAPDRENIPSSVVTAFIASEPAGVAPQNRITSADGSNIVPYADVIRVVFREYNGKKQMRRWNQTWGYWVDPNWITIS